MPHPSTSPAHCPDPPACISPGDAALCSYNTASSICLNPECFGLGVQLRAEPWLCHGNLCTWSWTLPKTIDQIQTNTIPPLSPFLLFLPFALLSFQHFFSFAPFPYHQAGLRYSVCTKPCPLHLFCSNISFVTIFDEWIVMIHFLSRCFSFSSQRIHLDLCDWDNLFPVAFVRFPTGRVLTCRQRLALTCLDLYTLHHQLSNWVFIHFIHTICEFKANIPWPYIRVQWNSHHCLFQTRQLKK